MKHIIIITALLLLFAFPVCAEENDAYRQEFELSGAGELQESLTDDARQYLEENGIDPSDYTWVNGLTGENVFSHIFEFIKNGAKTPLRAGAAILGIILITAAFSAVSAEKEVFAPAVYASTLAVAAVIASPVWASVSTAAGAVKGSGIFMLSFVPVFAAIVTISGSAVTAVSMSALLLAAAQAVTSVAAFAVLPLMGGYLAMSLCAGVSPLIQKSGIAEGVRKISVWILSFVSTLFVGILGIQTAVNSAADSLAIKTTKFIVGTSVPIAGAALSEAVSTLSASMSLLRSSVGIYGVVALAAILLPILAELTLWRAVLLVCGSVSDLFTLPRISSLLKAVDMMLSLLLGITLLTGAMFIISLTVVISFGRPS